MLAIDYDVVVKGLKPKFGELTDKNAREFRSFFDKIIQLPFAMPVSSYKIDSFLIDALSRIGYLTAEEQANEELKSNLSQMAMYSVGTNPRSLKRLTNILSLIQLMTEANEHSGDEAQTAAEKLIDKQVNFALVCLQIIYPLVYNTLLEYPNFRQWGNENGDSNGDGKTLIKKLSLQELTEAEQKKLDKQGEDFDEPWERILFRVCLKDSYLASRVVDISRLLNKISMIIPKVPNDDEATAAREHDDAVADTIERLIRFSAVTNVHATEETVVKKIEDFNPSGWLKQFRDKFEPEMNSLMAGEDTLHCTNGRVQSNLYFSFAKQKQAPLESGSSVTVRIAHDDNSYYVYLWNGIAYLHGGMGSMAEEEQALNCPGLHDSVAKELQMLAARHPEMRLDISDNYSAGHPDGQKYGSLQLGITVHGNSLEELVEDKTVKAFAAFFKEAHFILCKLTPEISALCFAREEMLREQLKKMDISPFTKLNQWYSQTYLDGAKIGNDTFGITLLLDTVGFKTAIWESQQNPQKIEQLLNTHPEVKAVFSQDDGAVRGNPEIIPFDGIISWVKEFQKLLLNQK